MEDNTEEVTQTSNILLYFALVKLYQLFFQTAFVVDEVSNIIKEVIIQQAEII